MTKCENSADTGEVKVIEVRQDIGGDIDGAKLTSVSENSSCLREEHGSVTRELTGQFMKVMNLLEQIRKISSRNDIDAILTELHNLRKLLPGPLTVQKLLEIDKGHWANFAEDKFVYLLECVVGKFDHNFPKEPEGKVSKDVEDIFTIEDPNFFIVTFRVILRNLKRENNYVASLVYLLESLLQSDALFAYISHSVLHFQNATDKFELNTSHEQFEFTVMNVVTLHNRVANILEGNSTEFFTTKSYANFLVFNALKVIEFLSDYLLYNPTECNNLNINILASLLSKIIIDFNQHLKSEAVISLVGIISVLTNQNNNETKIYRDLFNKIFYTLERSAVEIFAKVTLINFDSSKYNIKNMLGNVIKNPNWKFVLCTKIPLLTYLSEDDDNLIFNLVVYICSVSEHELYNLLLNLVNTWTDKSAILHTSVEQHLYITKMIIVIANCYKNIGFSAFEQKKIQVKLYLGLPIHLENSTELIRACGMKTSEILINFLNKDRESQENNELKFEYDSMKDETKKVLEHLDFLFNKDLSEYFKSKEIDLDVAILFQKLLEKVPQKSTEYIPPKRIIRQKQPVVYVEASNEVVAETVKSKNKFITIIDSTDFELDSDDDLEPYDLSNDVKKSKKEPPAYLRDLRDGLLETQDHEVFAMSLENCEKIIANQLPDDDPSIGLEILEILISLEPRFYVENFDQLVFQSCVSITCVYPVVYSDFLCKHVHAEIGRYSISHRIFVLDVLGETAKTLSSLKFGDKIQKDEPVIKKIKKSAELEKSEEIIRQRLESKTRRFVRHKHFRLEKINKFSDVAGYFFFPLLYGYNQNKMISTIQHDDSDCLLLIHFIRTLAVVICAAQNCPIAPRMAKEIFSFSFFLRFHKEVKVRIMILTLLAAAVMNVPKSILLADFLDDLFEVRLWLIDVLSPNVNRGDPNLECRAHAASLMCLIEDVVKLNDELET